MIPLSRVPRAFPIVLLLLAGTAVNAQVKQYSIRDFFKNPDRSSYRISPDGKYFSFTQPYEKRMNVFVQPRDLKQEPVRVTSETARDIAGYWWKGERILYAKDNGGDENFHLFSVSRTGKDLKDLTPFDSVTVQVVDGLIDSDDEILIAMNKRDREIFDVYHLDLRSGALKMIAENPGNISSWVTDHSGKLRAATTTDGVNTSLLYRDNESEPFRTVMTTDFRQSVSPLFFTFDNKHLYAASNVGRDKLAIVKIDPATGKELEVLFEHPDVDVENLGYSHKRKVLTSISYERAKLERKFLDKQTEAMWKKIADKLPGQEINIGNHNRDEDIYILRTYSDRSRGGYYLYEKNSDKLTKLVDIAPWINENDMAEMKPISFRSRDGLTINGYLTLPKGKMAKNLPIIVNPHGGPWARDSWHFNPEVQMFANRGYGVLQINFRGSTGYGRRFWESSFKQWGQTMQNDISDGVQWLVKEGIANPKQVAIYGASYGGYATLAGLTMTPDLYTCGIDYVGVSNLFTFLKSIPPYWKPYLDMFHEMVGHPQKDSLVLAAASPVFHVNKIKAPLLVIQGAKDPRVNINESNQIVEALKQRGIEVPYLVKDNEGHGFSNEENRFEAYEAMEKFLAKHLKSN